MSKIKLLLDVVENMRSLSDSVEILAQALADGNVVETTTVVQNGNQNMQITNAGEIHIDENAIEVTHEMVRELAVKLSHSGKRDEIKNLINQYGVKNVTAIEEDDLEAFYAELSAMEVN